VNETFVFESLDPSFNCSTFDTYHTRSVIKGDYSCLGTHQPIFQPRSGLSGGAIAGIVIGCLAVAITIAIGAFPIRRLKRSKKKLVIEKSIGTDGKAEMNNEEVPRKEMPTGEERHELTGEHGVTEIGGNADEPEGETYELPGGMVSRHSSGNEVETPLQEGVSFNVVN
jgi:hypothetical protein